MAKYKVLERSFINLRIHEVGEVVEHEFTDGGTHGPNLEPADDAAKAASKPARGKKGAPPATGAKAIEPLGDAPPGTGGRAAPSDDASDLT